MRGTTINGGDDDYGPPYLPVGTKEIMQYAETINPKTCSNDQLMLKKIAGAYRREKMISNRLRKTNK